MRFTTHSIAWLLTAIMLLGHCTADDELDRNIERLRSSRFEEREEGTRGLIAAGERAVVTAKIAASDGDLEVRVRGMWVLEGIVVSPEEEGSQAAEKALGELAKSSDAAVMKLAENSLRIARKFRQEERQKLMAALRMLGGVALQNENGEVYRIDFEGEYITDEGLEAQQTSTHRFQMAQGFFDRAEFASKYIIKTPVTDKDLEILRKFPALTYLNLQRTKCSDAGLVHLKSLRKLEHLVLNSRTTDDGLAPLAGLRTLKSLCLAQTQVTGVGVAHLSELSHLEELDLTNSPTSDAGLEKVSALAGLVSLKLGNTRVTNEGAKYLSRLGKLQRLTLHGTSISNEGLRFIVMLGDLQSLELDRTKVTGEGIGQLASLKHLVAVSFTEPLVSKQAAEKLRLQKPKTSVYLWPETPNR